LSNSLYHVSRTHVYASASDFSAEEIQSPAPLDEIKQAPGQNFAYEKITL